MSSRARALGIVPVLALVPAGWGGEQPPPVIPVPPAFLDTFDGPSFNPALEDVSGTWIVSGGDAWVGGCCRSYVRTPATNYNQVDFVMEVEWTLIGGGGEAGVFIGIGDAEPDVTYYGEPLHSLYLLDHAQDFPWTAFTVRSMPLPGTPVTHAWWDPGLDGRHRLRMTKSGDALTFELDQGHTGVFVADYVHTVLLSAECPFLDETNSRLFFGTGQSPSRIHEMSVSTVADGAVAVRLEPAAFELAMQEGGLTRIGAEDFAEAILPVPPPEGGVPMDDPLDAATDNGVFAPGDIDPALAFRSNVDGLGAGGPNPRGAGGLVASMPLPPPDALVGVGANVGGDGLEIASASLPVPPAQAMSLVVWSEDPAGSLTVTFFDEDDGMLAQAQVPGGPSGSFVSATPITLPSPGGPPSIARVTVWDPAGGREGVYAVESWGAAPPCPADFDGSGDVGFSDLLAVIGAWGPCAGCPQDLNGNGAVDFADLLLVIGAWGPC